MENYHEEILNIRGSNGRPDVSVYKHKFNEVLEDAKAQFKQGEPGDGDGAPAMPASTDGARAEDAGPAASAAAAAEAPPSKGKRGKAGGDENKLVAA